MSLDSLLSKKYKEMAGYYNIVNISNNTLLEGAVTCLSALYVTGASIFNGNVTVGNDLFLSNNLNISDNLNVTNDVRCTDDCSCYNLTNVNDIRVLGSFYITNSLDSSNLQINNAHFHNNLNVSNGMNIDNLLTTDTINAGSNSLDFIADNIVIGSTTSIVNISGTVVNVINSDIIANNKLIELNSNPLTNGGGSGIEILGTSGNGYIKLLPDASRFIVKLPTDPGFKYITTLDTTNSINVSGYTFFKESVSVNSSIDILNSITFNNEANLNSNIFVSNTSLFNDNLTITGDLVVSGNSVFNNNITCTGNLTVNNETNANNAIFNSNTDILGSVNFNNNCTINSKLNLNGTSDFNNNLSTSESIYITNNTICNNNITVNTNLEIIGNMDILNDCNITSDLNVNGNSIHTNSVSINSIMNINSNAQFNNNLSIGTDTNNKFTISNNFVCPLREFEKNSLAALNNVPLWGFYRTGGIVKVRLDVVAPVIDLLGINTINASFANNIVEPGVTSTDNIDSDIIPYMLSIEGNNITNPLIEPFAITTTNMIVPNTDSLNVGTYTITYIATDVIGNETRETRTLNVI